MNSSVVERWAENSEVVGSNPTLNTMAAFLFFFSLFIVYYYTLADVVYSFSLVNINFSSEFLILFSSFIFLSLLLIFFFNKTYFLKKNKFTFTPFSLRYYLYYRYIKIAVLNNFWKFIMIIFYFLKKNFLLLIKDRLHILVLFQKLLNNLQKLNLLWRPLFKRWSYYGLFSKTRTFWIRK